jgi:hypothetical protein
MEDWIDVPPVGLRLQCLACRFALCSLPGSRQDGGLTVAGVARRRTAGPPEARPPVSGTQVLETEARCRAEF